MKLEEKRIFISDLPETATKEEIQAAFNEYGKVKSIQIKERKELGPKNFSLFFAYVNVEIDDLNLQKCFKDFSQNEWHGQYVQLQVARESFLDRLKREREENEKNKGNSLSQPTVEQNKVSVETTKVANGFTKSSNKESSSESSSEESESEEEKSTSKIKEVVKNSQFKVRKESSSDSEDDSDPEDNKDTFISDLIIKNNKGKQLNKNGLVIESVGKEPILKIDISKKKPVTVNNSEANLRRLQSVNQMKQGYKSQKLLIAAALAKVDTKQSNKVVFESEENENNSAAKQTQKQKKSLFDDGQSDEEDFEGNFKVKEQFAGKKGQKLLELQSKYKNDKRFVLDERFIEDETNMNENTEENGYQSDELTLEEEKQKQFEILGEVLGKPIVSKSASTTKDFNESKKKMLRFDPNQPDHLKYEIQNDNLPSSNKRKRKDSEGLDAKKVHETEQPEVSKELFYKVTDNLKESLHGNQEFSLLSMFGKVQEAEETVEDDGERKIKEVNFGQDKNPFRYDSSDDEDQTKDIPNTTSAVPEKDVKENRQKRFWSESFFFKDDDYRLQEGFDFVEKMKLEEQGEFTKLRRDLKEIVRSKVRNNQRKDKPFKKKLGGNKKRKNMRIKKALKR